MWKKLEKNHTWIRLWIASNLNGVELVARRARSTNATVALEQAVCKGDRVTPPFLTRLRFYTSSAVSRSNGRVDVFLIKRISTWFTLYLLYDNARNSLEVVRAVIDLLLSLGQAMTAAQNLLEIDYKKLKTRKRIHRAKKHQIDPSSSESAQQMREKSGSLTNRPAQQETGEWSANRVRRVEGRENTGLLVF